jgi:hypothetical protein
VFLTGAFNIRRNIEGLHGLVNARVCVVLDPIECVLGVFGETELLLFKLILLKV